MNTPGSSVDWAVTSHFQHCNEASRDLIDKKILKRYNINSNHLFVIFHSSTIGQTHEIYTKESFVCRFICSRTVFIFSFLFLSLSCSSYLLDRLFFLANKSKGDKLNRSVLVFFFLLSSYFFYWSNLLVIHVVHIQIRETQYIWFNFNSNIMSHMYTIFKKWKTLTSCSRSISTYIIRNYMHVNQDGERSWESDITFIANHEH